MMVEVLYFAAVREAVGSSAERLTLPEGVATVSGLRAHLASRGEAWQALAAGQRVRAAVNQRMVEGDAAIAAGDEIAFFPPVTGG